MHNQERALIGTLRIFSRCCSCLFGFPLHLYLSLGPEAISRHQVSKCRVREHILCKSGSGENEVVSDAEIPFEKDELAAGVGEEYGQLENMFFAGEGWER